MSQAKLNMHCLFEHHNSMCQRAYISVEPFSTFDDKNEMGNVRLKQAMCVCAPYLNVPTARLFCIFFKTYNSKIRWGDTKIVHAQKFKL